MHRRTHALTWQEKQRRIPKLPGSGDRGAPLPKPQSGYEYVNRAGRFEDPVIVAVKKPEY